MTNDYISRDDAIIEMMDNDVDHAQGTDGREVVQILSDIPVADVAPVRHGKWTRILLRNEKGGCIGAEMICSECGSPNGHDEKTRFCPNCGAKMDGERREE